MADNGYGVDTWIAGSHGLSIRRVLSFTVGVLQFPSAISQEGEATLLKNPSKKQPTLEQQQAAIRAEAAERWQEMAKQHHAGRSPDLGEVESLAAVLGVPAASAVFLLESDGEKVAQLESLERCLEQDRKQGPLIAKRAAEATRRLEAIKAEVSQLTQDQAAEISFGMRIGTLERQIGLLRSELSEPHVERASRQTPIATTVEFS